MRSINVAIRMCLGSVVCTALVFGFLNMFDSIFGAFWGMMAIFLGGPFVALILFAVAVPLINWSTRLPFNDQARLVWVVFWLAVVIVGMAAFFMQLYPYKRFPWNAVGTTIAGITLAGYFTRHSFKRFYEIR